MTLPTLVHFYMVISMEWVKLPLITEVYISGYVRTRFVSWIGHVANGA